MTTPLGITFPAPTADWGKIVAFAIAIDLRDRYPRTTPKDVRRYRHIRRLYRSRLRAFGLDTGPWFRSVIVRRFDHKAQSRARPSLPIPTPQPQEFPLS